MVQDMKRMGQTILGAIESSDQKPQSVFAMMSRCTGLVVSPLDAWMTDAWKNKRHSLHLESGKCLRLIDEFYFALDALTKAQERSVPLDEVMEEVRVLRKEKAKYEKDEAKKDHARMVAEDEREKAREENGTLKKENTKLRKDRAKGEDQKMALKKEITELRRERAILEEAKNKEINSRILAEKERQALNKENIELRRQKADMEVAKAKEEQARMIAEEKAAMCTKALVEMAMERSKAEAAVAKSMRALSLYTEGSKVKEGPKQESTLTQVKLELECPVCKVISKSCLFQCSQGHLICGSCKEKCKTCPMKCGSQPTQRCRIAERMIAILDIAED